MQDLFYDQPAASVTAHPRTHRYQATAKARSILTTVLTTARTSLRLLNQLAWLSASRAVAKRAGSRHSEIRMARNHAT
jgi:hypothetical protein